MLTTGRRLHKLLTSNLVNLQRETEDSWRSQGREKQAQGFIIYNYHCTIIHFMFSSPCN